MVSHPTYAASGWVNILRKISTQFECKNDAEVKVLSKNMTMQTKILLKKKTKTKIIVTL